MSLKKDLLDLYVTGKNVELDNGIVVWLQKLNPVQKSTVLRKANSSRQSVLTLKKLSDDHPDVKPYVDEVVNNWEDPQEIIDFLVADEVSDFQAKKEAEVAERDEWSEGGYLEGLKDAWEDSMKDRWLENNEDPEARRVYEAIKKFSDEVDAEVEPRREGIREGYLRRDVDELQRLIVDRAVEVQADLKWLEDYKKWQLLYAVRVPEDHAVRVFDDINEIEELQLEVIDRLYSEYNELVVQVGEGKD